MIINRHVCKLGLFLCVCMGTAQGQWSISQSDFEKSPLKDVYKSSPWLVDIIPDDVWKQSNFATPEEMQWFKEARYGMYIHFGLSTYKNRELSWGIAEGKLPDNNPGTFPMEEWTTWPNLLKLERFSKEELADILRKSGMKYVVVVAKHHDGFHFYKTKYSDFNITQTPYQKDFVREVIEACRMANVKVGVYFSQRDWYHPDYEPIDPAIVEKRLSTPPYYQLKPGEKLRSGKKHKRYLEYMFATVRELCTNYGKLDMFNFDAVSWGGMFTADMWEAERLTRMIRELQPGIIINNRASVPGDYDSPEQRIGMYQDSRMWETCMCLCDTWAYSPTRVKTAMEVFKNIQATAIGNGNLLMSWGMKWDGSWDEQQKQSLLGAGVWLKSYGDSIYKTHGGPWLPAEWGGSTYCGDRVYVHVFQTKKPIQLAKIPGMKLSLACVMTGQDGVVFREGDDGYTIDAQQVRELDRPLIVELKASRPVLESDIRKPEASDGSIFENEHNYGKIQYSQTVQPPQKELVFTMKQAQKITGIQIVSSVPQGACISVSLTEDGQTWREYRRGVALQPGKTDITLLSKTSGALTDGIVVRGLKITWDRPVERKTLCHFYGFPASEYK